MKRVLAILLIILVIGCTLPKAQDAPQDALPFEEGAVVEDAAEIEEAPVREEPVEEAPIIEDEPVEESAEDLVEEVVEEPVEEVAEDLEEKVVEKPVEEVAGTKYGAIISGDSQDSAQHYEWYLAASLTMYLGYKQNLSYDDDKTYYLFESDGEQYVQYKSTKENIKMVIDEIAGKAMPQDQVTLFFIGHGSSTSYNAVGEDVYDYELAEWLDSINAGKIIVIMSPCMSGGFVEELSAENRVIITSTRASEGNRAEFAELMMRQVKKQESLKDAYNKVREQIINIYNVRGWGALSEHALLDDNGDGVGHYGEMPLSGDGGLAAETYV